MYSAYKLNEKNPLDYISAFSSVLKCNKNVPFLKQIVLHNEKWILYNNVEQKETWGEQNELPPTTPKASLHPKKIMLCMWWEWKGVVCYEILTRDQIANIRWIMEQAREFQKNIYFCFIDYAKAFDCVDHNKLWKFFKRWDYQTT